jgi:hypothetical protein
MPPAINFLIGAMMPLVSYRGQIYKLLRSDKVPSKNRLIKIHVWETRCAECGKIFECTTQASKNVARLFFSRRCPQHQQPGVPIGKTVPFWVEDEISDKLQFTPCDQCDSSAYSDCEQRGCNFR